MALLRKMTCNLRDPMHLRHPVAGSVASDPATGWRECLKLQVIFRKRATNYRALLWKMTYNDNRMTIGIRRLTWHMTHVTCLIHVWRYEWVVSHDLFICDKTHLYERYAWVVSHDISICDMTHSYVWWALLPRWFLNLMCDMIPVHASWFSHRDCRTYECVISHIDMSCDTTHA